MDSAEPATPVLPKLEHASRTSSYENGSKDSEKIQQDLEQGETQQQQHGSGAELRHRQKSHLSFQPPSSYHVDRVHEDAKILPWLYKPEPLPPVEQNPKARFTWLVEGAEVTDWLNLFYDLVVVAILNVFSTNNEMKDPASIGVFFSYFVIVYVVWTSQVAYDVRFAAEDYYHRFAKLCQVVVFVYIGAGSSGWSPLLVASPSDPEADDALDHLQAHNAFRLIAIAYAVSRGLLLFQYCVVSVQAKRAGRSPRIVMYSIVATSLSLVASVVAAALPAPAIGGVVAKLVLFYGGIAIEGLGEGISSFAGGIRAPYERVSERFGCLTLIILGEGVMSLLKGFNKALSSFSNDASTYVQVFCACYNIFLLFLLLFSRFDKHAFLGRRQLFVWLVLHFPLHFLSLCALIGFVSNVTTLAVEGGLDVLTNLLATIVVDSSAPLNATVAATLRNNPKLLFQLDKLDLIPTPIQLATYIDQINANVTSSDPDFNTANVNPDIISIQYLSQAIIAIYSKYGMEASTEAENLFFETTQLNTTLSSDTTANQANAHEAVQLFYSLMKSYANELNELCFWLIPASGAVMIAVALVTAVREPTYYLGPIRRWALALHVFFAAALCFLGFLNVGYEPGAYNAMADLDLQDTTKYAPVQLLVGSQWALPLITLTWTAIWLSHFVFNRIAVRKGRK